jgi:hypothetical protein
MSELHRITLNAEVCGGRPCLRGTRVRVGGITTALLRRGIIYTASVPRRCAATPFFVVRRSGKPGPLSGGFPSRALSSERGCTPYPSSR